MLALCDELGVRIQIDPEVKPRDDGDRSPLEIEASAEGLARHRRVIEARVSRGTEITDSVSPAERRRASLAGTDKHCGAGSSTLAIDPYGRVYPCVQWRVAAGNLHEQPIHEIWAGSPALEDVRETTKAVRRKLDGFGDAGRLSNFCPGAAHVHSGDPLSLYPAVERRMSASGRARIRLTVL